MYKVDNAVIMAAGTSSRFVPLSYERHKALTEVKGEILIERQLRQLLAMDINDIYIVTGYKAGEFEYLKDKFGVKLISNREYNARNNNSSIYAARDVINNTYICSSDNYFADNPFSAYENGAYYAVLYSEGYTDEWCVRTDSNGYITNVTIGGSDSWYMLGHTFWDERFSSRFIDILSGNYNNPSTADMLWENIYIDNIDKLPMQARKYPGNSIYEFDSLDDLRKFDSDYVNDTKSAIIKHIAAVLDVREADIGRIYPVKNKNEASGFEFTADGREYIYMFDSMQLKEKN